MKQYVYTFREGDGSLKKLLGGKGANLAEMTKLGIPVPEGFVISTDTCRAYIAQKNKFPEGLWDQVLAGVKTVEKETNKTFGSIDNPLLVSVRSGAAVSMPGMMDTVLNLGLNDESVKGLAEKTGNERFAYDAYRRFIQMFGNVVLGISGENFEEKIDEVKAEVNKKEDTDLTPEDWKKVIKKYKELVLKETEEEFPQDPAVQLKKSVSAVFDSWMNPRAITYRRIHKISDDIGTGVTVQSMVFGNMGETSGTGVAFTRDPSTGEKKFFGEFLMNAQGEDVVAGTRTPHSIEQLEKVLPKAYKQLVDIYKVLEKHFRDMQDIEFTIENEKLYMLQTRNGKRSAAAALKMAIDMFNEKLITKKEAIMRVDPLSLDQLLHPRIKQGMKKDVLCKGLPASPGAASGKAVFTADDAEKQAHNGEKVILIRHETSPEDIHGMHAAKGVLTACGGMTSHAAVVARGMGTPCVSGATTIIVNAKAKKCHVGDKEIKEGDFLTLDGSTGEVMLGLCETEEVDLSGDLETILSWASEFTSMKVRTNADTPEDAKRARSFGAEGIGLCRTEHMFFDDERIAAIREMILSSNQSQREKALDKLLPFQRKDFYEIFKVMESCPVTVRLLDPPLHEFLPHKDSDIENLAKQMSLSFEQVKDQVVSLHETNPMLGHRGCRLMMTYPEIVHMQVRAIVEAACNAKKDGIDVKPEIMIPLVGLSEELQFLRAEVEEVIQKVFLEKGVSMRIKIGTMIELPRACMCAKAIAEHADFFSFGTNDLTQMTFGYSRDDVGKFLPHYLANGYLKDDPFQVLDQRGVGSLIKLAVENGRKVNKEIKIGICGEHGGDPSSIDFCFHNDFNYVSCSPFRVPIARLAVAQSTINKWNE